MPPSVEVSEAFVRAAIERRRFTAARQCLALAAGGDLTVPRRCGPLWGLLIGAALAIEGGATVAVKMTREMRRWGYDVASFDGKTLAALLLAQSQHAAERKTGAATFDALLLGGDCGAVAATAAMAYVDLLMRLELGQEARLCRKRMIKAGMQLTRSAKAETVSRNQRHNEQQQQLQS